MSQTSIIDSLPDKLMHSHHLAADSKDQAHGGVGHFVIAKIGHVGDVAPVIGCGRRSTESTPIP